LGEIIRLYYFDNFRLDEIARRIGRSHGTVRNEVGKARIRLAAIVLSDFMIWRRRSAKGAIDEMLSQEAQATLVRGTLSDREFANANAHLRSCECCRAEVEALAATDADGAFRYIPDEELIAETVAAHGSRSLGQNLLWEDIGADGRAVGSFVPSEPRREDFGEYRRTTAALPFSDGAQCMPVHQTSA